MLQNFLSGEGVLLRNGGGVRCCEASNGSAEAFTPRSFKMETNMTPKNNPGNFVSPTLLFFSFVFACFHLSILTPSFSTHTPLLKLPCPSQKDTRETAGSIRAGKNKSGLCHMKTHRPRKRPRWKLWQGCNEQRTCGVVLQKLGICGPTCPRREHQSGEL